MLLSLGQHADQAEIDDLIAAVREANPDAQQIHFREFLSIINDYHERFWISCSVLEASEKMAFFPTRNKKSRTVQHVPKFFASRSTCSTRTGRQQEHVVAYVEERRDV